jgi:hypothetical protein
MSFVPQLRPWSWQAFALAFVMVLASAVIQGACVALGAKLYFAAFLPAIFIVGIAAGVPAAAFAILLTIPLVWWAFIPPFFAFEPLTMAHVEAINLFFLFSTLLAGFADLCRQTMLIGLKLTDESGAANPQ